MDYEKHLRTAKVPENLHEEAIASLKLARERAKGLTLAKWKVRLFKAGKISRLLEWEDERLCLKRPDLAAWDIAPMLNITAQGDHLPWMETPEGGRPNPNAWLNKDPESAEYQEALAHPRSKRYFKGRHPRSRKGRKMWYRRNAGEYAAWERGAPIASGSTLKVWRGPGVRVGCAGGAWILVIEVEKMRARQITLPTLSLSLRPLRFRTREIGPLVLKTRIGFEVDNVFSESLKGQSWYPVPGYELRAPATWSVRPVWGSQAD